MNYGGCGLLKSTSGKAEGPYEDVKKDGPLTPNIDASLFVDDDGKVYFVWQNGMIARLNDNMTDLAEKPRHLKPANAKEVGFEGAFLFKAGKKYILTCASFERAGRYDCMAAASDSLMGPYGDRYLAVPHGGHNMFFRDKEGQWWSTLFGSDQWAPVKERAAILRVTIDAAGRIAPVAPAAPKETVP
jgi:beta-xylosidase